MTRDEATAIVGQVLRENEITVNHAQVGFIAEALQIASEPEFFKSALAKDAKADRESRARRVELLKQVITEYDGLRERQDRIASEAKTERAGAINAILGITETVKIIESFAREAKVMLQFEERLKSLESKPETPSNRPKTAKNGGSAYMFVVLSQAGVSKSEAYGAIADLLMKAGIATESRTKTIKALRDSLDRVDLDNWL